jgi:hypothetical protein
MLPNLLIPELANAPQGKIILPQRDEAAAHPHLFPGQKKMDSHYSLNDINIFD